MARLHRRSAARAIPFSSCAPFVVQFLRSRVRPIGDEGSHMRRLASLRRLWLGSLATLAITAAACGSDSSTPTTPTPATTTESFSGIVGHQSSSGHPFTVTTTGTVTITLTAVAPLTTMSMGVGIGIWDGTSCTASSSKNDNARSGTTALTGTANAGSYCVNVYDSGNVPADWEISYNVQVVHP